jgi:mannosyltransferase
MSEVKSSDTCVLGRERALGVRSSEHVILAAILIVAATWRFYHLGYQSFNGGDEPYSLALAQRKFPDMLELFGFEANGTLYSLLLWPVSRLGESEAVLRAPAAVAGVLAVAALWWAGRELVSPRAGLIAAGLLAISPMAIAYSQYARPFSLLMLFVALAFGALIRGLRGDERRWWVVYAAAMVGAAYANTLAPFTLVPAQAVLVLIVRRDVWRRWALWLGVVAVALTPLAAATVIARSRRNPLYWVERPDLGAAAETVTQFGGGSTFTPASAVVVTVLLGLLALRVARVPPGRRRDAVFHPLPVLAWATVPPLLMVAFSFLTPLYQPQYAISALPGMCLLVAAWVEEATPTARIPAVLFIALAFLAGALHQTTRPVGETWRSAIAWIEKRREPGDRVLLDIASVFPVFGYYDKHWASADGDLVVYEWEDRPFPRSEVIPFDDPGGYAGRAGPPGPGDIARNASGDERLFVVFAEYVERLQGDLPNGRAMRWARRNCRVQTSGDENPVVYLIDRCPTALR